MHLYRYALDGSLVNEVTRGDWAVATADDAAFWVRQSVAGVDEREGWVYFVSLQQSPAERQLYRVRLDGSGLSRVSAGRGSHAISMSPDTSRYFDAFTDVRTPPGLTLRRADASLVAELAPPPLPDFARRTLTFPEITTIPARDGFRMPALVFKPVTLPAGQRLPVIMFVYGGPSAPTVKDAWQEYTLFYQLLLDAGYSVVQVDNRAATGISKTLENTILRKSGGPETEDLADAARWLKAQSWVDRDRLGVFGWSGGGTMTLNLLTRTQEFKAGISIAPVTDWRYYDTKWAEALMRRPADNPEGYNDFSLVRRAPQLHGRLLLVFGTDDDNVHPQNEQAFIDALIRAGITFDTAIYPMRTHGIGDDAARIHLFKTMLEFWKRWL
jgi:dipeptidyl-peptidase-4